MARGKLSLFLNGGALESAIATDTAADYEGQEEEEEQGWSCRSGTQLSPCRLYGTSPEHRYNDRYRHSSQHGCRPTAAIRGSQSRRAR